ncbi:MAG: hypothetical protein HYZ42_06750 [Bacteroidetes bacterium]|nr:hypothetical protein [Bacteroidota bacterium]
MNFEIEYITIPNFDLISTDEISKAFIQNKIFNFHQAIHYIKHLPYGRNTDKNDLTTIFTDGCGTCSTKHAILKQLADENQFNDQELVLAIVKMDANNTPEIAETLAKHQLSYIPEAHNYLKYQDTIFDFTKPQFIITKNSENILTEMVISPHQITDYKVAYHKEYISKWLANNNHITYTSEEIWSIREQCIKDLAAKS